MPSNNPLRVEVNDMIGIISPRDAILPFDDVTGSNSFCVLEENISLHNGNTIPLQESGRQYSFRAKIIKDSCLARDIERT